MADEEELLRGELKQSRELGFGSLLLHRVHVSPEGLVEAAVVRDVLALSQDSVQLKFKNLS